MPIDLSDLLISADEVARLTGYTVGTLAQLRCQGKGPAYVRKNRRCVRYRIKDVLEYLSSKMDDHNGIYLTSTCTNLD